MMFRSLTAGTVQWANRVPNRSFTIPMLIHNPC